MQIQNQNPKNEYEEEKTTEIRELLEMQIQNENPQNEYEIETEEIGEKLEIIDKTDYLEVKYNELVLKVKIKMDEIERIINKKLLIRNAHIYELASNERIRMIQNRKLVYKSDRIIIKHESFIEVIIVYVLLRMHRIAADKAYDMVFRLIDYYDAIITLLNTKCPRNDTRIIKVADEEIVEDLCESKLKAIYNVIVAIHKALNTY